MNRRKIALKKVLQKCYSMSACSGGRLTIGIRWFFKCILASPSQPNKVYQHLTYAHQSNYSRTTQQPACTRTAILSTWQYIATVLYSALIRLHTASWDLVRQHSTYLLDWSKTCQTVHYIFPDYVAFYQIWLWTMVPW